MFFEVFSAMILGIEAFQRFTNTFTQLPKSSFSILVIVLFFSYYTIEMVLKVIIGTRLVSTIEIVPVILLFVLLNGVNIDNYYRWAVLLAFGLRLVSLYIPVRGIIRDYGCFVLDAIACYFFFVEGCLQGNELSDKLLFVFLVISTLSTFHKAFPFYYFLILGFLLLCIPMKKEPIDWSLLEKAVGAVAEKVLDASYGISNIFGNENNVTGYSSFDLSGNDIRISEKPQVMLETTEMPYIIYNDVSSEKKYKMQRTVYLAGGVGPEENQLISFLKFLYSNDVSPQDARSFSKISNVTLKYVYINTYDEIAPINSIQLSYDNSIIKKGVSSDLHKKDYEIKSSYLDIDYGSAYLSEYLQQNLDYLNKEIAYEELADYAKSVYGIALEQYVSESQYNTLEYGSVDDEYYDASGCTEEMLQLANEITKESTSDYEKCKRIEAYLRQYQYSTSAVGGYNSESNMATASGMSDIAERFLFDSKQGYCVHYTSAMVMLLRLSGIPARPMRGFRYTYPFETAKSYVVDASCSHTWPEAYIKGVGWIPFEPTAAYPNAESMSWKQSYDKDEEYNYNLENIPSVSNHSVESVEGSQENGVLVFIKIVGIVLFVIVILVLVIIGITWEIKRIKYKKGTPGQKLAIDVDAIKKRISLLSEKEFNDRGIMSDYIVNAPEEFQDELFRVFSSYYRLVYGNDKEISIMESQEAANLRAELNAYRKSK